MINYFDNAYQNESYIDKFEILNKEINAMMNEILETMCLDYQIDFLIISLYGLGGYWLTKLMLCKMPAKSICGQLRRSTATVFAPVLRMEVVA